MNVNLEVRDHEAAGALADELAADVEQRRSPDPALFLSVSPRQPL